MWRGVTGNDGEVSPGERVQEGQLGHVCSTELSETPLLLTRAIQLFLPNICFLSGPREKEYRARDLLSMLRRGWTCVPASYGAKGGASVRVCELAPVSRENQSGKGMCTDTYACAKAKMRVCFACLCCVLSVGCT